MGKLDGSEILSDVPKLLVIATTAQDKFTIKPTTFEGWALDLGFGPDSIIVGAAKVADQLHTGGPITIAMAMTLFGIVDGGVLGLTGALVSDVIEQLKD